MTEHLPDELQYGFVADRILKAVGDTTSDTDRYPDGVPANGTVRFTPMVRHLFTQSDPATVSVANIECTINPGHDDPAQTGLLVDPAGHTGNVALVVGWYQVSYLLEGESPDRFTIQVKPEHTNEEPLWLPRSRELKPQPSERFVVNEQVYKDTLAARDETVDYRDEAADYASSAATDATAASNAATTAVAAKDATLALGITVDTSVGTRVFVGDTMIHGDTGRRDIRGLLNEGFSASTFEVRRIGDLVELVVDDLEGPFADPIISFPAGFRPPTTRRFVVPRDTIGNAIVGTFQVGGSTRFYGDGTIRQVFQWTTTLAWPTSLPGLPA